MPDDFQTQRNRYAGYMEEIHDRLFFVDKLVRNNPLNQLTLLHVEVITLNIRKILEAIAFSALYLNYERCISKIINIDKMWNAKKILKKIEKMNPDFFPTPVWIEETSNGKIFHKLTDGFLGRSEFDDLYDRCSNYIHSSDNPYREHDSNSRDVSWATDSLGKIRTLIQFHMISFPAEKEKIICDCSNRYDIKFLRAYACEVIK
ncbi:MAG: hypothetical protein ACOX52_01720 [Verrucomicrobiota bacterium]|jgi:hypothetical protein